MRQKDISFTSRMVHRETVRWKTCQKSSYPLPFPPLLVPQVTLTHFDCAQSFHPGDLGFAVATRIQRGTTRIKTEFYSTTRQHTVLWHCNNAWISVADTKGWQGWKSSCCSQVSRVCLHTIQQVPYPQNQ